MVCDASHVMNQDTYNNIFKWSARVANGLSIAIPTGLSLGGLMLIGMGLLSVICFDRAIALSLLACGSLLLCFGSLALARQLREHSLRWKRACRPTIVQ
jgi:hypothetical protein